MKSDSKLRRLVAILSVLAGLSTLTWGYLYFSRATKTATARAHAEAEERLGEVKSHIESHTAWHLQSVRALAGLKGIEASLPCGDVAALARTNAILDHFNDAMKTDVCYLMDRSGNTIASSNRNDPDSFVNKNFSFRPYFQKAIEGRSAVYMALGSISKKRGIYFSHPVYATAKTEPSGVAVIKTSVVGLEKNFMQVPDGVFLLTDPFGVVFASSRADWLFEVLWEASAETLSDIRNTQQFGQEPRD